MRIILLGLVLILVLQMAAWSQEAPAVGLKGPVHTVLTEEFTGEGGVSSEPNGSTFDVYDRLGYQVEVYRYKSDGSLWVHTVISRNGPQILKTQTTGTAPFESHSVQNVFDTEGHLIETDKYDANGILISKSKTEFLLTQSEPVASRTKESSADGTENTTEVIESTDPRTGITHQVQTRNGKLETDWTIQPGENGNPEKDKIIYADGSYNERERGPDGTTVEDRYFAPTRSHTHQKSDAQGHLIEVIERSDSSFIRCTYTFDQAGRPTGQINYDASGKILDKATNEYRNDSYGNWTEKKAIVWDTKSEPMKQKIVATSLRSINYY